jgi:hypothetical protein
VQIPSVFKYQFFIASAGSVVQVFLDGQQILVTYSDTAGLQVNTAEDVGFAGVEAGEHYLQIVITSGNGDSVLFKLTDIQFEWVEGKTALGQTVFLDVTRSGSGSGRVLSEPAGIDCGNTCNASFLSNTRISLVADPSVGSTFTGWNGACTNLSGPCVVNMDAAKSVNAGFSSSGTPFNLITHYYTNILNRVADDGGKAFWQSEVSRMSNLSVSPNEAYIALALNFFTSAEFLARGFGDEQFVRNLYLTFYNREADQGGLDYWRGLLSSGLPRDMIMYAFMFSPEFGNFMIQNIGATYQRPEVGAVIDYYRGAFGRLPDDGGLKYWVNQFRVAQCSGNPTAGVYTAATSIASAFFGSPEYNNAAPSANKYISDLFNAFMRRSADLEGYNFWVSQVATGAQSKDAVRQQFVESPEFAARVQAIVGAACTGMMQ